MSPEPAITPGRQNQAPTIWSLPVVFCAYHSTSTSCASMGISMSQTSTPPGSLPSRSSGPAKWPFSPAYMVDASSGLKSTGEQ